MYKIYTKDNCDWCIKAKKLLTDCGIEYTEMKLNTDYTKDELRALVPETLPLTVPQVFLQTKRIGGYEDLAEYLEHTGIMGVKQ